MKPPSVKFEEGAFGLKAIFIAPWSVDLDKVIRDRRPDEIELNTAKGWSGERVDFLSNYLWLKSLIIIDYKLNDVSAVHDLSNLEQITIFTYCNTSIDFNKLPNLRQCSIEWRKGVSGLFSLPKLIGLFVNKYSGRDVGPLLWLGAIQTLAILNAPIHNIHGLNKLSTLESLRLAGLRSLDSLVGIEGLENLISLEVEMCKRIGSISPISTLENLETLHLINDGDIESLSPLRGLSKLRSVIFYESTNILDGDLSPIFDNRNINDVSFQNRRHYSHKREEFVDRIKGV